MKIISTRVHGIIDYLMGALLIVAPWLLGFDNGGAETWIPVVLGVSTIIYSLLTDYELGASPQITMKTHLGIDAAAGLLLAASPWLFGFADIVYLPHLILGLLELGAVAMTETTPEVQRGSYKNEDIEQVNRHDRQKVNDRSTDNRAEQKVKADPQRTASNNMHNDEDQVHKAGIHNRSERAAEPHSKKSDDVKNNPGQKSHTNVNRVTPENNEERRSGIRQENNINKRAAKVESPMNKQNDNGSSNTATNRNNNINDVSARNTGRSSNLESPSSDQNISSKTQKPSDVNRNTDNRDSR